jgi:hypothetical protein
MVSILNVVCEILNAIIKGIHVCVLCDLCTMKVFETDLPCWRGIRPGRRRCTEKSFKNPGD